MTDYQTVLASFVNFFSTVAQVSGSLVGLIFVALTFNDKVLGSDGHPGLRALAKQIFADFLLVLLLALMMLVPHAPPQQHGFIETFLSVMGISNILRSIVAVLRNTTRRRERGMLLQRFGLSLLGNGFLLVAGVLAIRGQWDDSTFSAYWSLLVSSVVMLLLSGSRAAWLLVTHPRETV